MGSQRVRNDLAAEPQQQQILPLPRSPRPLLAPLVIRLLGPQWTFSKDLLNKRLLIFLVKHSQSLGKVKISSLSS